MMRDTRLPWLLSLSLMASGCLGAHSVAYRVVGPSGAEAGHGYLGLAPLVLAIGVALGIVAAARSALPDQRWPGAPAHLFALLPPLAFTVQEHLERALQGGDALGTTLHPAFLLGFALQLPLAFCSLLVTRTLFRVAKATGALLWGRRMLRLRHPITRPPSFVLDAVRVSALASAHAGRAPPLAA